MTKMDHNLKHVTKTHLETHSRHAAPAYATPRRLDLCTNILLYIVSTPKTSSLPTHPKINPQASIPHTHSSPANQTHKPMISTQAEQLGMAARIPRPYTPLATHARRKQAFHT